MKKNDWDCLKETIAKLERYLADSKMDREKTQAALDVLYKIREGRTKIHVLQ